ncbi:high mobility group box domain-containing protein [Obelidium mucronatum]|nr:high mobility group box domain-containing protein [Obelidium mucronatum]
MPRATKGKVAKSPKAKAKKDPNAPKKALSAYFHFAADNRARIKEENPSATFGEIGKILGAEWKEADEATKQKYTAQQEKDKARYVKELEAYKEAPAAAEDDEEADADAAADEDDE